MKTLLNLPRRAFLVSAGAWIMAACLPARAQTPKRPIGIIGAGNIGGGVGSLWIKAGHPVMFSSRVPDELADMVAKLGPLAHAGTVAQALAFADVILVAVPYAALPQIGSDYAAQLKGKIVLDATNAVPTRDGAAIAKRGRRKRHWHHHAEISSRHACGAGLQYHRRQCLCQGSEPA